MIFRADLHCHSVCSDGTDSPRELVDLAVKQGLSALSITDHDTVDAYVDLDLYAQSRGIDILRGVEFSCYLQADSVHVLGYGYEANHPAIQSLCQMHQVRREERNQEILARLHHFGMNVTYDELRASTSTPVLGRPHIAALLHKKGFVISIKDAFDQWIGEGKRAFYPGRSVSVEETIHVLHAAGGKAILAHPHLLKNPKLIQTLLEHPFDGLEAFYAYFPLVVQQHWVEIAQKKEWLITGGSDYHGTVKPQNQMGSSWINEDFYRRLKNE